MKFTTGLAALALLLGGVSSAAPSYEGTASSATLMARTTIEPATSCVTVDRGRKYVTRITRDSGVQKLVNLRLKDRVFGGEYLWRVMGGPGGLVVGCRVVEGVVRIATKSGSRVWVVPPTPITVPTDSPAPPAVATWDGPLTLYAPIGDEWALGEAIMSWNAGLPADRQMSRVTLPCAVDDPYCIEVVEVPEVRVDAWGIADWRIEGSRMTGCDIRISEQAMVEYRPAVLAHELGHCLGLPHWHFAGSIMYDFATTMPGPLQHDVSWLAATYSPDA